MTRRGAVILALLACLAGSAGAQPGLAPPALEPASTGGVAAVDRALARLATHRRLLVIAAHPDDEDTSALTYVARGLGGESAYLSLSRGEGGQNLVGPELGVGLGLLRSRELLAARQVDGGRQFFTRAYDFGYTRSIDETLRLWPREVLLEDAVRVVRRFKPQVIVSVFPPTAQAGHGQHQAAGVTAPEAFRLAGDKDALPQLAGEGLDPWTPSALYRSAGFNRESATLTFPLGRVDPLTGRSVFQLAMASRGMHRSQDMGRLLELGPQEGRSSWVEGGAGKDGKDLFAGIDTRLAAIAAPLADEGERQAVAAELAAAEGLAVAARAALSPGNLEAAVEPLAAILRHLRTARERLAGTSADRRVVASLLDEKIAVAEAGLAAAAGLAADATTAREALTAGEGFTVQAVLWNSGARPVERAGVALVPAPEWGGGTLPAGGTARPLAAGELGSWELPVRVPPGVALTVPYFLRRPLTGALYDWSAATPAERGEPFGPPPLAARFTVRIAGVELTLEREVVHRHRDQALGEIRRPLAVVPRVEVAAAEPLLVWPLSRREPQRLQVTLTSHAAEALNGRLEASSTTWGAIAPAPFALPAGDTETLALTLAPPADLSAGRHRIEVAAVAGNERQALAVPAIDYPHVRPTRQPQPAAVEVSAVDLRLPPLRRVGYVRGAADRVPEFLRQAGVPVEMLGAAELEAGAFSGLDAVVIGSRAYETEPALAAANARLLDWVKAGGLLIVQYQQYPFVEGKFAPLPLEIARPHDRVTDETAPARPLDPAHPVFRVPNEIGEEDWRGWVQERGLYFAHSWDPAYVPLLSLTDPGGPELKGGLLVAPVGKGTYVYTGLAFFRQLPAGVPGAFRLFANLLALKNESAGKEPAGATGGGAD